MNTTITTDTNTVTQTQQAAETQSGNWMLTTAGFLFWITVAAQILLLNNNMVDYAFADHIIYNVLPLTGALAFFGIRKEQKAHTKGAENNS